LDDVCIHVDREKLNILMETYYKEVEKLRDHAIQVRTIGGPVGTVYNGDHEVCICVTQIIV